MTTKKKKTSRKDQMLKRIFKRYANHL